MNFNKMINGEDDEMNWVKVGRQITLFLLFLACGVLIFVFGSSYFTLFPTNESVLFKAFIPALFLMTALLLKRSQRYNKYWQIFYAFFIAAFAFLFARLFHDLDDWVLSFLDITADSVQGLAVAKMVEALLIVSPILVLTKLGGGDLGSIYLKRGNLKFGIGIGLLVLINFISSALLTAGGNNAIPENLIDVMLWGLIFSLANAFMEELWFRGIFLRKLIPLIGVWGSVILAATIFSFAHVGAPYLTPAAIPIFLVNLFTFGISFGYVMWKTDSLWGAVLIHAAADVWWLIVFGF
jgi:membrane protease YdiL (CAAX protease family)